MSSEEKSKSLGASFQVQACILSRKARTFMILPLLVLRRRPLCARRRSQVSTWERSSSEKERIFGCSFLRWRMKWLISERYPATVFGLRVRAVVSRYRPNASWS